MKSTNKILIGALILILGLAGLFYYKYNSNQSIKSLRLTTTTSVNDSGLMDYLRGPLLESTGIELNIVSKGSGAALEDGKNGNADVLIVHAPDDEEKFISGGYGKERIPFMFNYFVIVGPENDPAQIAGLSAEEAFSAIVSNSSSFASRGDDSGTHKKELKIWDKSGVSIENLQKDSNYYSLGQGMGETLIFASENQAYTLTDLATYLSMKEKLNLKILVDQSDSLKNIYSVIVIDENKIDGVNSTLSKEFIDWIKSDEAKDLINSYGKDEFGQSLFIYELNTK